MPTLYRSGNLIISMNGKPREHAPPHFHVDGPGVAFTVKLADLQILAGRADRKALSVAVAWAEANIDLLEAKWSELNDRD